MARFFFSCNPWDLADEGYERALGRLAGEIGVEAVAVDAVTDEVTGFRPRTVQGPKKIHVESGAHFQPSEACYANSRIRPVASPWIKSRNPLSAIAKAAEANGLSLRVGVDCCCNRSLAQRYPWAARVDLYGDADRQWLCPSHPDVREYLASLIEDLSKHYPVETVEVRHAHFGWLQDTGWLGLRTAVGVVDSLLLTWCFCSACRQRGVEAGVDMEAARRSAVGLMERRLANEGPRFATLDELLTGDAALAACFKLRKETVTSLVRMIRERTRARFVVPASPEWMKPAWYSGADPSELGRLGDAFLVDWHRGGLKGRAAEEASVPLGEPSRVDVAMYCTPGRCGDGPALVSAVHEASTAGHGRIGFYDYGQSPEMALDWVRQAIRYARREAGE